MRTDDELRIAHLYRRAGFGLAPDELQAAVKKGFDACLAELVHPETVKDPLDERLAELQGELFDLTNFDDAQCWWLYRMIHTRRPLLEKMTLFWHGHFATANSKVDNPRLMVRQNQTLRDGALGKFGALVLGVARDPAMIVWLDNGLSSKSHPNENFARELLELFTLGIGNYGEDEVRAAARAFTGWKQRGGEFFYDKNDHDEGAGTFLGETWAWSGEEILERLARHPATAAHLAAELVRFFVADEGDAELEPAIARVYLESGGDVRACVEAILRSAQFQAPDAYRARMKSPVELAVGAIRELKSTLPIRTLLPALVRMGQSLFNPPTVKGWDGGFDWINTATLFERAAFANQLATQRGAKADRWFEPDAWVAKDADGATTVAVFADALLDGRISAETRATLEQYLMGKNKDGAPVPFKASAQTLDVKARGPVRLIVASPEYQLA